MKKLALFVFSLLALSCSSGNGWVRVEGNKFIDPKGKEIIFRGLCFSDPVKLVREGHWNEEYFAEAAEWGANIVRFAVHPGHINSLGWDETFAEMDKGVEYAKKYGYEEKPEAQTIPHIGLKCPVCGSTNIKRLSNLNRGISVELWGAASSKIGKQYECRKCKHKW
jgi:hypothetical protein